MISINIKPWNMRLMCLSMVIVLLAHPLAAKAEQAQAILHALDYIAVDYPGAVANGEVVSQAEYSEQVEFSENLLKAIATLPQKQGHGAVLAQLQQLNRKILQKADSTEVAQLARNAGQALARIYQVRQTPRAVPDLKMGAELYHGKCVSCHGLHGNGDGPAAAKLDPPPINFHDLERAKQRSVYGLYNAISLGVEGTKMRSFHQLSEGQRWALAFYVSNFAFSDAQRKSGEKGWASARAEILADASNMILMTPAEIEAKAGNNGLTQLSHLRAHPEAVMGSIRPLDTALEKLASSFASYNSGNVDQAYRESVAAYLEGFELAEPTLRAANPLLVSELEQQMMGYRNLIKTRAPQDKVKSHYERLVQALEQAHEGNKDSTLSGEASAISAAVILLREGLEAILILAAIAGVLIKTGRRDAMPYLHAGWSAALLLGGATWAVSTYLFAIGGANRELTEGITALLAAAVLVYVGFWLHGKTNAKRWREFVEHKIKGALQGRALWALALVAFLAVYREVFETVLFYQALWMQTAPEEHLSIWIGIIIGAASLLLLGWLILYFSMRLPLRPFFAVNSVILFVLAVAFSGHGIAALQAVGIVPVDSLPVPRFELLGIYPTVETTVIQLLVASLVIFILMKDRIKAIKHKLK